MEYILASAIILTVLYLLFGINYYKTKQLEKKQIETLRTGFLTLNQREYSVERMEKLSILYEKHLKEGQIDSITWNDLSMDDIFKRLNYTRSATGEEYLYYLLRTPKAVEDLKKLDALVSWYDTHEEDRLNIQVQSAKVGYMGKYSIYDYLDHLDDLGVRTNLKYHLLNLLYIASIVLIFVSPSVGVMGLVVVALYHILVYFKLKQEIDPYITSFAYIYRLIGMGCRLDKLRVEPAQEVFARISHNTNVLKGIKRNSFWVMSPTRGNGASGDIVSVFLDYIRMLFFTDICVFNNMLSFVREHTREIDELIMDIGYLETSVSVWIYRQSLENGYCIPRIHENMELWMEQGYHPLLEKPVKNSIHATRGVLLTGSNASGKSTFLKTVAVNSILAQTIYTVCADRFSMPQMRIYSSMSLRDDIESGESYYIVEIKALKRILDAASDPECRILCFVDEVLRGTNTVERISASTEIMSSLKRQNVICFAATHDIELTSLLEKKYDNYHFEEEVCDGDIHFQYKLLPGKATTRNAIRLLALLGYDDSIIELATRRAEKYLQTGSFEEKGNRI